MSIVQALPNHLRPRREKVFGDGRPVSLDRNAKVRVMFYARALSRRTEKGKHYGQITAKALAVLQALLWGFHNGRSGLCFPSYETIAEKAGCARSTVAEAIRALELAGVLSWVNRIVRVRERCVDLFGKGGTRSRVLRTSNAYHFRDPGASAVPLPLRSASKSDYPSGTLNQDSIPLNAAASAPLEPDLMDALARLGAAIKREEEGIGARPGGLAALRRDMRP